MRRRDKIEEFLRCVGEAFVVGTFIRLRRNRASVFSRPHPEFTVSRGGRFAATDYGRRGERAWSSSPEGMLAEWVHCSTYSCPPEVCVHGLQRLEAGRNLRNASNCTLRCTGSGRC